MSTSSASVALPSAAVRVISDGFTTDPNVFGAPAPALPDVGGAHSEHDAYVTKLHAENDALYNLAAPLESIRHLNAYYHSLAAHLIISNTPRTPLARTQHEHALRALLQSKDDACRAAVTKI
jgi:hypothetical protein